MNSHGNFGPKYLFCAVKIALFLTLSILIISCAKTDDRSVPKTRTSVPSAGAIDINKATIEELERLPGVGKSTAKEIIEFRKKYGNFKKTEHLMLIRGISDKRFRKFRKMVRIG